MNPKSLTVYLIAGEASGDALGAGLMRALKAQRPDIRFLGVGGEKMEEEGLSSLFPYEELSLMGFAEILPHMFSLLARVNLTVEDILTRRPDVVITIDSPGFNFRVAAKLRKHGLKHTKLVHYVAPTVWAYKPERAKKCAQLFDHMLVLLPFEPPYFEKEGLACTFVGHQAVWRGNPPANAAAFREKYKLAADTPLLALLPGSRMNEIKRHMPVFARAVTLLAATMNDVALVVPVPKHLLAEVIPYFENCPYRAVLVAEAEDRKNAIAASQVALVKSGTIALEVAASRVPMVVAYKVNTITAFLVRRMLKTRFVNLVNILQEREVIPELLQELCRPVFLATAMAAARSPERLQAMHRGMDEAVDKLQPPGPESPAEIAARQILFLLTKT